MRRPGFLAIAVMLGVLLAVAAGWAVIPSITIETFARHFPVFRTAYAGVLVSLLFFGPAFVIAALVTALFSLRVVGRSPIAPAVTAFGLGIVTFPVLQLAAILISHVVIGPVIINPGSHLFTACVAGLLFGAALSILVLWWAKTFPRTTTLRLPVVGDDPMRTRR
jgi:hypothetical protein